MKTYRNLYPQVHDAENLYLAYRKARKGKRRRPEVAEFEFFLEDNLVHLQDELEARTYRHGAYRSFTIHEPKRRLISAAPFRDRVVHHALMRVIEPIFERAFIHDSYANRIGKGTHRALNGFRLVVSHNFPRPAGNAVRSRLGCRGHVLKKHGELARPVPGRPRPVRAEVGRI